MTRKDMVSLIATISSLYPSFKPDNRTMTVNAWMDAAGDLDFGLAQQGLKAYARTNTSGFAPTVGQLLEEVYNILKPGELTDMEAWGKVQLALQNSSYGYAEQFNNLDEDIQAAVGSANDLRAWALCDENYVETVIMPQFLRTYRTKMVCNKKIAMYPENIKKLVAQNMPNSQLIENHKYEFEIEEKPRKGGVNPDNAMDILRGMLDAQEN